MKIQMLLFLYFTLFIVKSYSQDTLSYHPEWQLNFTYGYNFPITRLLNGDITDNLSGYSDKTKFIRFIDASYFFHKKWGFGFNLEIAKEKTYPLRKKEFDNFIRNEYGSSYKIETNSDVYYSNAYFHKGYLSIIYRIEKKRFYFLSKLSLGFVNFYRGWGIALLKKKNSNNKDYDIRVLYSPKDKPLFFLSTAPSLSIGYKIMKNVYLNTDFTLSYFKANFQYTKTTHDIARQTITNEGQLFSKNVWSYGIGSGLTFKLNNKAKK